MVGLMRAKLFWGFLLGVSCSFLIIFNPVKIFDATLPILEKVQNYSGLKLITSQNRVPARILCWVLTKPDNQVKAQMVNETWGRKCDKLLFINSKNDSKLPTLVAPINGSESRNFLSFKAQYALEHIYDHYLNDFDWFLKADDDSYVIMENLREYLATLNNTGPLFVGREFKQPGLNVSHFLTGGPGYLLAPATVKLVVENGFRHGKCKQLMSRLLEDVAIGECVSILGGSFVDTRDTDGSRRFLQLYLEEMLKPNPHTVSYAAAYDYYPFNASLCCSHRLISLHQVSGHHAKLFEFLIYKLKVAGRDGSY